MKENLEDINEIKEFSIKNDCFPITIGGDHSVVIASALASINKYKELGIIWFDSHGDYNTFETTSTGNIHGLPLAAITGYKNELLTSVCLLITGFLHSRRFQPGGNPDRLFCVFHNDIMLRLFA